MTGGAEVDSLGGYRLTILTGNVSNVISRIFRSTKPAPAFVGWAHWRLPPAAKQASWLGGFQLTLLGQRGASGDWCCGGAAVTCIRGE